MLEFIHQIGDICVDNLLEKMLQSLVSWKTTHMMKKKEKAERIYQT